MRQQNWVLDHMVSGHLGNGLDYLVYVDFNSRVGDTYQARNVYADGGYTKTMSDTFTLNLTARGLKTPWSKMPREYIEEQTSRIKQSGINLKYDWKPADF